MILLLTAHVYVGKAFTPILEAFYKMANVDAVAHLTMLYLLIKGMRLGMKKIHFGHTRSYALYMVKVGNCVLKHVELFG